jgi:phospholipase/lecithinase/hemolysin
MKKLQIWAVGLSVCASAVLVACGGGGAGDQTPRVTYGKMVIFGDSLSDVGTYEVSGVAAAGGGKFTVNGDGAQIWVERLATQLGVPAPCAAQTGINAVQAVVGFPPVPAVNNAGCFDYAQGGARVTNPIGPGNIALFNPLDPSTYSNALGLLTVPVVTQIANHLAATGGSFASDDLVTVLAGANDVLFNLSVFAATVAAGGNSSAAATAAVTAVTQAAAELAGYLQTEVISNGAQRVVVVNVPDISKTPFGLSQTTAAQGLLVQMVTAFNTTLASSLTSVPQVLIVDAYTTSQDQAANPGQYALTNVTTPACDLANMPLPTSLVCTASTLISGDTSFYEYADTVHPTPYGYRLLAQLVTNDMAIKGWL